MWTSFPANAGSPVRVLGVLASTPIGAELPPHCRTRGKPPAGTGGTGPRRLTRSRLSPPSVSHGLRRRIKRRELVSKRRDSDVRCGTLRFDPLEVQLCFREFSDQPVPRCGGRVVPRLFFAGRFHSKVSEIRLRIASQARATREPRAPRVGDDVTRMDPAPSRALF